MEVKRGKPIGYRTSNECNSCLFNNLGGDLTTARKGKTITKHTTGENEVERDLQENENNAPCATERTMTDFMRDELGVA